ncbi:MAG: glycosyltransferase [Patescibacteria group bacterium]
MNKNIKIVFYCSWGGFGHVARSYSIISKLPKEGSYTVATPEDWPFKKPNKNFKYKKLHKPKSRIRLEGEELIVQDYEEGAQDVKGYKKHLHQFIDLLKQEDPDLVVVDNPAEVSLITKILGYKTVVMYETLNTNDLRWRMAWKSADKLLAPYPEEFLKEIDFPYLENTYCSGGFTRFESNPESKKITQEKAREKLNLSSEEKYILITVGKGETAKSLIKKMLSNLAQVDYKLLLAYPNPDQEIKNLVQKYNKLEVISGVFEEMYLYLISSDIIVAGAGYNSVMEAFSFQKPTISIPLSNIYNEQIFKAKIFSKLGALSYVDPDNPELVYDRIKELEKKNNAEEMIKIQKRIVDGSGSKRAADKLVELIKND